MITVYTDLSGKSLWSHRRSFYCCKVKAGIFTIPVRVPSDTLVETNDLDDMGFPDYLVGEEKFLCVLK